MHARPVFLKYALSTPIIYHFRSCYSFAGWKVSKSSDNFWFLNQHSDNTGPFHHLFPIPSHLLYYETCVQIKAF